MIYEDSGTSTYDGHYLLHPAWAARVLAKTNPKKHIDISSILQFSTIISAFIPTEFYEFRPAHIKLSNFSSHSADLLYLPFKNNSVESVSCMHVVEHLGLGRYGDPLDSEADLKAMSELARVLKPGGSLLFVVPIGKPRLQFNAHRIYSYDQIRTAFNKLKLKEFSLIPDNFQKTGIIKDATPQLANQQKYSCGCFWFNKPTNHKKLKIN